MPLKTVFLGTPAIAVPFLETLQRESTVLSVITNPDQPAGRGYELKPSPVKEAALRLGLPILQPEKASDSSFMDRVKALKPEVGIVVAYGKLLKPTLLGVPKHGFINVHFSLLPAYRGAAPIQWTLINGEMETGVTLFWLDEGMDTGPIFLQKKLSIKPEDDAESLRQKLVLLGVDALKEAIGLVKVGNLKRTAQVGAASLAPMLTKEAGRVDWNKTATEIVNLWRGLTPWPGIYTMVPHGGEAKRLKLLKVAAAPDHSGAPGTVVHIETGKGVVIKCGQGALELIEVQPEGKKPMSSWDFWQGARLTLGEKLL